MIIKLEFTWNHVIMYELIVLRIFTQSCDCLGSVLFNGMETFVVCLMWKSSS